MEYVAFGKTGLNISRLGFGGIPIQKVDAKVTRALVERMVEVGMNYIDTAWLTCCANACIILISPTGVSQKNHRQFL